jgi:hypothetical protein
MLSRSLLLGSAFLFPLVLGAEDGTRPICNYQNQGRLWPEAANRDRKAFANLMRCGELYMCVRGTWHYRWETPSVRIDQLDRHAKSEPRKTPVCEVQSAAETRPPETPATN